MTPWQLSRCDVCGAPPGGVLPGPSGFSDEARQVLCRAHYEAQTGRGRSAQEPLRFYSGAK